MKSRKLSSIRGFSFTEYALILGVVMIALLAMQAYVRRGTQGKIKDITDAFISSEQVGQLDTEVTNTSVFDTKAESEVHSSMEDGRITRDIVYDTRTIKAKSHAEEQTGSSLFNDGATSYAPHDEAGFDPTSDYTDNPTDMGVQDWELETDPAVLCEELARLNEERNLLEQQGSGVLSLVDRVSNALSGGFNQLLHLLGLGPDTNDVPGEIANALNEETGAPEVTAAELGADLGSYENRIAEIDNTINIIENRLTELGGSCG